MSNDIKLSTFPAGRREALALLYVQSQNLSEKTPEDLAEMYVDAYKRISDKLSEQRRERNRSLMDD